MQRVTRSTAVTALPAPPAGGTPGYFTGGDPVAATPATVPGYEWFNNVQEELLSVIEGVGLVASGTDRTQLRQAIESLIETRSGNYVLDTGVANAYVAALNPALAVYENGQMVRLKVANANTGASTLDAGAGPKPILNDEGAVLLSGDLPGGSVLTVVYDAAAASWYVNSLVPSQALSETIANGLYAGILSGVPVGTPLPFAGTTIPAGYLQIPIAPAFVNASTYSKLAFALGNDWGVAGTSVTAGSFVPGDTYIITAIGTTDFTAIGALSNTVGIAFTATGAGAGTGTANDSCALPYVAADGTLLASNGSNLGTTTSGQVIAHTHSVVISSPGGSTAPAGSIFGIGGSNTGSTGGSQNTAAGSRVNFIIKY